MIRKKSKIPKQYLLPLPTRLKRTYYYPFQRFVIRTIRELTDANLMRLRKRIAKEPTNAELHFEIAKEYYSEYKWDHCNQRKAKFYIRAGLSININAQPYFQIIEESTFNKKLVIIIEPKASVLDQKMILDGFSFYSYLLLELGEFLIEKDKVNIVYNMQNVDYLADCGDGLLISLQREAQKKGGDLKCVNVNDMIREVGELMEWPQIFGFYESTAKAVQVFEKLEGPTNYKKTSKQ